MPSGYEVVSLDPFQMIFGTEKKSVIVFSYEGLLLYLITYSNKPLMSTRITDLCQVLNSFVLLIHSWVLLMLLRQGLSPIKNVNAATGSTLYYIFLHSCFTAPIMADALLFAVSLDLRGYKLAVTVDIRHHLEPVVIHAFG